MSAAGVQRKPGAGRLVADLKRPGVELRETHISWVFLDGDDVFKVKKPVSLGFLDFSTPARRRRACAEEVKLNRRLAPDVYLGVEPVTLDKAGRHRLGGPGPAVDWAVHMRRLPDAERADVRLAGKSLESADVERIAAHIAAFHGRARCDEETSRYGSLDVIAANVEENFEQTRTTIGAYLSAAEAAEVETWQRRFLERRGDLFHRRLAEGRVRDGHGDLRLDHIYLLDSAVTILDCIEFNRRFRFADVCADVAFFAMDLTWHGRADLAERFLAAYAHEANDYDLYPLVDFYESYRAFVRGKIAALLATDESAPAAAREQAAVEARRYYLLALASERRSLLPPAVVAIGGLIAAGKSTVARRLAVEMSAPVVDADHTRKHLLGIAPQQKIHVPPFRGAYDPEVTDAVYAEVLRRARAVLDSGRPVLLDASFRSRAARAAVRGLAREAAVPFLFVECRAPRDLSRERLSRRAREDQASDGRLEIFDEFAARWEEVDELPATEHAVVDTREPLEANVRALSRRLATWPRRLTS